MVTEHRTYHSARAKLREMGMRHNRDGLFSDQEREYWWYGDGTDACADHSATITRVGQTYLVSTFRRKAQA